jgi:sugar/nucleoside kinase (ribokinase family)
MFDYVTVGHVTRDAIERNGHSTVHRVGGSALYSALQAARLGLRALILTQGVPSEIEALLAPYHAELELRVIPAEHTTTLSTRGTGAERSQRVLAWAGPIVEPIEIDTAILHLAPVARETPVSWSGRTDFVGITPQGLIRAWRQDEDVSIVQLDAGSLIADAPLAPPVGGAAAREVLPAALDPASLPCRFDAAVISDHERDCSRALFSAARECGAPVAVTAESQPTTIHLPESETILQTPAPPAVQARDDIGAGDVFAAGFFVALADGHSPVEAAIAGNKAAAFRIAGIGPGAIGRRVELSL